EHRDGRRPGRIPDAGHRAGASTGEGRTDVRGGAALDSAPGPERRPRRRNPRQGDGADRGAGVAHRTPRAVDAPYQRRRQCGHASRRHRRRAIQDRRLAARRRGATAHAQALSDVQGSLDGGAARAAAALDTGGYAAVSGRGLPGLRHDRISRPPLDCRESHDEARGRRAPPSARGGRPASRPGQTRWHVAAGRAGAHGQPASKVLLVDDEDSLRKVMRDLLERDGYAVTEARDGVQALDQVDRVGPDIIVLDLNLPGLDGYGVLSHLRSRPATANIPVIVLTAKGDEDNEVRVFELGADDFLTKPFRARALSARLEAVLGRRR